MMFRQGHELRVAVVRSAGADVVLTTHVGDGQTPAIAVVSVVIPAVATDSGVSLASQLRLRDSSNVESLIDSTERVGQVNQLLRDRVTDGGQTDNHAQDSDRQDENQLGRNNKTSFVIKELTHIELFLF